MDVLLYFDNYYGDVVAIHKIGEPILLDVKYYPGLPSVTPISHLYLMVGYGFYFGLYDMMLG